MSSGNKKNISILTISLASGGAEKVISLLLPELVKTYNVHLVLFYENIHFPIPEEVNTVILHQNQSDDFSKKIFKFPRFISRYHDFVRKNQIDASISFLTRPNFINGFIKMRHPDIKVIIGERCYPSIAYKSSNLRYWLYKFLIPILYNKADIVFSNSKHINDDLTKSFRVKTNLEILYNPVIMQKRKESFSSNDLKLISVGSLKPIKNPSMIINAIKNIDGISLTFLGDGQLRKSLEQEFANDSFSKSVSFEGTVRNVNPYLTQHDCFILSSNSEGFPNVILEAMATGLPVISTNCMSGPLEILNENKKLIIEEGDFVKAKYGLLVNVGDVIGLEKAIRYLLDNPKMLIEYGKRGYERARDYTVESIYAEFEKMIEKV
ncbi:glycosyltransferase [Membranicola marinus]|uniref:Glycosyltransferase n=1 Tax=Membranihabitans marinus TaxID=1227546 RepID=A0A953L8J1_9BACT|nr:glycosyltransferase [Membranihabitans marinus]MBY5956608.1 glycosyltransferase [Membranihabitans marinus]